jgi:ubiquinone/menaquinone biosynthesis C-methylase UbiE
MENNDQPINFINSYEDEIRAKAYSKLEFEGTYHLAFRDIPQIIEKYSKGNLALDFGCGTGRSTRFLKNLGLTVIGIDISSEMIKYAKECDPSGDYRVIKDGDFGTLKSNSFNLILSAFTFDNIPTVEKRILLFKGLNRLLNSDGILINLVSSPEMYTHEWVSFSTKQYPQNKHAKSGDVVQIITTDITDARPCFDIFWTDKDYRELFSASGFKLLNLLKPLATGTEPVMWINETRIAPWIIYMLSQ